MLSGNDAFSRNRQKMVVLGHPASGSVDYNVNNLNQYTSAGGATYGYDVDGNLTSKQSGGAWSYAYDDENRLIAVTGPSQSWSYQYDALGNRVAQTTGSTTTQYLVNPLGLGSVVAEFDGSGKLVSHFAYGLDLTSTQPASGSAAFYQFDGSANTATVTGAGGAVLDAYTYLPFGEKLQSAGTFSNPFTFAGEAGIQDDGDGLYYMRARYYDPAIGRFISEDPAGFLGSGTNLNAYVDNNPISSIDPTGLCPPPSKGCPANQRRFFANLPLYKAIAKKANTNVNFIMAISVQESGWNGRHSQELNNLFGTTHAGGLDLSYASYQASATAWANSYSSWVNGATTINQFVGDLLNHVPPYNVNAYGDYSTAILGGTFKNPALHGASTIGTYQSVLNYESACGVNP